MVELSPFAKEIFKRTYAFTDSETWEQCAERVSRFLARDAKQEAAFFKVISERKFIPGGRYLYSAGRELPQLNNCLNGDTEVLTRGGIKPISELVGRHTLLTQQNGRSQWVDAEIRCFGKQPLFRVVVQRGAIQKVIYATADHGWMVSVKGSNDDIHRVTTMQLLDKGYNLAGGTAPSYKVGKVVPSVVGIQHGVWFGDGTKTPSCHVNFIRLCGDKNRELLQYFNGYQVTYPPFANGDPLVYGGPNFFKQVPDITETSGYLLGWLMGYFAADGCVTEDGRAIFASTSLDNIKFVRNVCAILGIGTYSIRKQDRVSNLTGKPSTIWMLGIRPPTVHEGFFLLESHRKRIRPEARRHHVRWKVVSVTPTDRIEEVYCAVVPETHCFMLADEILTGNCFLFQAQDSREGWADILNKHVLVLSTGGGAGTEYSQIRGKGQLIKRFGGVTSGPLSLMSMVNEVARHVMAGGKRRSALWAGLSFWHDDIEAFITAKNWPTEIKALKEKNFNFPAPLDMTNISVGLDDTFFKTVRKDKFVWDRYYRVCKAMCKSGEPGFSINLGDRAKEVLRNPCCEVVSDTDSDCCNLGSINLGRIETISELEDVIRIAVEFLYNGTFKSWLPHKDIEAVREQKRRIGLGVMGLHEWCIRNGQGYEPSAKLGKWLSLWEKVSDTHAAVYAKKLNSVSPVAVRAIAPTGTIGIVGETTTGIEPIFCVAYKRRFLDKDGKWKYMHVVDPTAKRLIEQGVDPDSIEDAFQLSRDVEKRIAMQAFVQDHVDQAISSTINLPEWGEPGNNNAKAFADTLLKYLPRLRGITVYPDGSRAGQPLVPVEYEEAIRRKDVVVEESEERCSQGACGI